MHTLTHSPIFILKLWYIVYSLLGPGLELDDILTEQDNLDTFNKHNAQIDVPNPLTSDVEASETQVLLMPEYLLVCCWRSIKEVSLLLAHIISDAPVVENRDLHEEKGKNGLMTVEQVDLHEKFGL